MSLQIYENSELFHRLSARTRRAIELFEAEMILDGKAISAEVLAHGIHSNFVLLIIQRERLRASWEDVGKSGGVCLQLR